MLTLPASFVADIGTGVTANTASLAPVGIAVIALFVGFWVIKAIIGLFPRAHGRRS